MLEEKKKENIIEEVSNEEMQDFFVWLYENELLNTKELNGGGYFTLPSTHKNFIKFRQEKNAS